jgi:hypothetical protein
MHQLFLAPLVVALCAAPVGSAHAEADYARPAAARTIVEEYYKAIDAKNYRAAYRLWGGEGGASGKTYSRFRQGFAQTAHSRVVTDAPVNGDAAMGSVYVDVPVEVFATLKNGRKQHFRGDYTLRRVNDVDGATDAQVRWHLTSSMLKAVQ